MKQRKKFVEPLFLHIIVSEQTGNILSLGTNTTFRAMSKVANQLSLAACPGVKVKFYKLEELPTTEI